MKWYGTQPEKCDLDGEPIEDLFFDGATKTNGTVGPWAIMCPHCFREHGVGLGTGVGQRYEFIHGEWVKTGG